MKVVAAILTFFGFSGPPAHPHVAPPPPTFLVRNASVTDEKSVFATIESTYTVPARVRTAGTIMELKVRQGDRVAQGQVIATVGDPRLSLQIKSYAAQVAAAQAQLDEAKLDYDRAQRLIASGAIARNAYDQAHTTYNVAQSNLNSIIAQRAVVVEQQVQGEVLAPTSGRVITVPVTAGTVAMAGDVVATVAEQNFVLRLQVPERHARYLKVGDPVRLDGSDLGRPGATFGAITLIYPQVDSGHVVADATVSGLGDYFVGQRVLVWVSAGARTTIKIPEDLIVTRSGIDYARLWTKAAGAQDVPVQRGQESEMPGRPAQIEILSGLKPGDRLVKP